MAQPGFHCCHGHVLVTSTQATESPGPVLPFELAYTLHDRACGLHSHRAAARTRKKLKKKKKKEVILVTLARPAGTEYFHWFVVLAHFRRRARQGNALGCQQKAARVSKYQGRETQPSFFFSFFFFLLGLISNHRMLQITTNRQRRLRKKRRKKREKKKTLRVWWKKTLTWKVLECWPLHLTSLNMFPQAIP